MHTANTSEGPRVAIIGAGVAGLVCARALQKAGLVVEIFDKGRGPGGRVSTRREDGLRFDHGAQYFTARSDTFKAQVDEWLDAGIVKRWQPRLIAIDEDGIEQKGTQPARYVGYPRMSSLTRHLSEKLPVHFRARVTDLVQSESGQWSLALSGKGAAGPFDYVVSTLPGPQAAELFHDVSTRLSRRAAAVPFDPTWALMLAFDEPIDVDFDAAFVNVGPLSWVARNSAKPGRDGPETWVVHASPRWSRDYLELMFDEAGAHLLAFFHDVLRRTGHHGAPQPTYAEAHRWRYAWSYPARIEGCVADGALVLAGDWLHGARVEGAFESGRAAAQKVLANLAAIPSGA